MYRTFVKLDDDELELVRRFKRVLQASGSAVNPELSDVIRGMIRDYNNIVNNRADPDFLEAYRASRKPSRKHQQ